MPVSERLAFAQHDRRGKHGTVLAVCLIFLMLLTLLAISTLSTATLTTMMSGNVRLKTDAFYLAETAVENSLGTISQDPQRLDVANPVKIGRSAVQGQGAYEATIRFVDYGSRCVDNDGNVLTRLYFDIDATGYAGRNSVAQHTQGFYICDRNIGATLPPAAGPPPVCSVDDCPGAPDEPTPVRWFWKENQ